MFVEVPGWEVGKSYDMSRDMGRQEGSMVKRLWFSILQDLERHKKPSL